MNHEPSEQRSQLDSEVAATPAYDAMIGLGILLGLWNLFLAEVLSRLEVKLLPDLLSSGAQACGACALLGLLLRLVRKAYLNALPSDSPFRTARFDGTRRTGLQSAYPEVLMLLGGAVSFVSFLAFITWRALSGWTAGGVFLGGCVIGFFGLAAAMSRCPACRSIGAARAIGTRSTQGQTRFDTVTRQDERRDANGKLEGHTYRQEQVRMVKVTNSTDNECAYCGHIWSVSMTTEREG